MRRIPTPPFWLIMLPTVVLSATIGWLDYHASEVQGTVLVLAVVSGILAFIAPRHAVHIAIVMGLSVSGTYVVARSLGIPPTYPVTAPLSTLLALIPAALGAACG